jgi:hypothetical protein
MKRGAGKSGVCFEGGAVRVKLAAVAARMEEDARQWMAKRVAAMPFMWRKHLTAEHGSRGGLGSQAANAWLLDVTAQAAGRLPLSATDWDIREAAIEAARAAFDLAKAEIDSGAGRGGVRAALEVHCASWGIAPAGQDGEPGLLRMLDERWYLRRMRRAFGRRAEGAAINGGVVRRGLWPYASQDAVVRRGDQRKRNAAAMERAFAQAADGERVEMADIVAGSLANPENKRAELMVRIRGCDGYAHLQGWGCEFWTLTAPSRFHAMRVTGACSEKNPNYQGATPSEAQGYLCKVWARIRAALARRGLVVAGLRTAEPHHDGCPHWHLIVYGPAQDLTFARHLARWYALQDSGDEAGALEHRFNFKVAESGTGAAAYAAAYVSKNIDGGGMDKEHDSETGGYISSTVKRVDAWASNWGIRQFQFFGMPGVGIWRTLRRVDCGGVAGGQIEKRDGTVKRVKDSGLADGSALEEARRCADDSDWCGFWIACKRGGLALIKSAVPRLTDYGDAAGAVITGVCEGGQRLLLRVRDWVIFWNGKAAKKAGGVVLDLPRSCVNNCTGDDLAGRLLEAKRRRLFAINDDFAAMAAAIFDMGPLAAAS